MSLHDRRFPNESNEYRVRRDALLEEEVALRETLQRIAEARQRLPLGGELQEDYALTELDAQNRPSTVKLSQLFGPDKQSLILYSFMYGPEMETPCPACTSLLDGLNGSAPHIRDRVAFAVVAKSPVERIAAFAGRRGWHDLRLLSSHGTTYNHDYHAEDAEGRQLPAANVFVRRGGGVHHFYSTELLYADSDGHPRHADLFWPIWNLFDLTPEGRGTDWFPRLEY